MAWVCGFGKVSRVILLLENVPTGSVVIVQAPQPQGWGALLLYGRWVPQRITAVVSPARLQPYRDHWTAQSGGVAGSEAAIAALYLWQVGMSAAWYEVLAFTEMAVRHSLDTELRKWNAAQPGCGPDWLRKPATPLSGVLGSRTLKRVAYEAGKASDQRSEHDPDFGVHPRSGHEVVHDDLVAQLTFGNLVHLLPNDPPSEEKRKSLRSGYTKHEQLWLNATKTAFPNLDQVCGNRRWAKYPPHTPVPEAVAPGYALAAALERLRRLRNRVGHHEQTFRVRHTDRHRDAMYVIRAININAHIAVHSVSRVRGVLATQPRP
uniref:hypothetical protein n=1 Tax=Gordonia westfalica TaxID=158898 RepID=UPI00159573D2|nr:hypothetical protein [Gordonia westfalica]